MHQNSFGPGSRRHRKAVSGALMVGTRFHRNQSNSGCKLVLVKYISGENVTIQVLVQLVPDLLDNSGENIGGAGNPTAGARCASIKLDTCGTLVGLFDIW